MKVVLMGTPEFAVPSLKMLIEEGYDVVGVVTQPDKPKGRGNKLTPSPVKEYALSKGIKVMQPEKVKKNEDFFEELKGLKPDLLVTAAYGKILPQQVLDIAPYGCINVHGSLLPKYRGAAPIQWSIINGDKITGITTMYTDIGMDTGDMLLKREFEIPDTMTAGELYDELSIIGAEVLKETLKLLTEGKLIRIPQQHDEATKVSTISKELGNIDWEKPAQTIYNLIRGTNPWPSAYTFYEGNRMRIWKARVIKNTNSGTIPGKIIDVSKVGIKVETGEGELQIEEVQFDGGKRLTVEQYTAGNEIKVGTILKKY